MEFLASLVDAVKKYGMEPLVLCLMPNHWHGMFQEGETPMGEVLQPVLTKFAMRSNLRNGRIGHVFQGRFKSFPLDSTEKAKELLRYIHKNPIRAKLVDDPALWPWSSHAEYAGLKPESTVSTRLLLSSFSEDPAAARKLYLDFMKGDPPKGVRPDFIPTLDELASRLEREAGFTPGALRMGASGSRSLHERHRFIRLAVQAGVPPGDIAAYLRISRSTVFYAQRA